MNHPASFLESWNTCQQCIFTPPKNVGGCWQWTEVSQRVLVLHASDHFSLCSFLFQDSKEYGHTFRRDLKEEILMLMARDRHPPEVSLCWHSGFAVVVRCILTSVSSNTDGPVRVISMVLPITVENSAVWSQSYSSSPKQAAWKWLLSILTINSSLPSSFFLNFSLKRKPIVGFEICGWSHYYPRAECFAFFFFLNTVLLCAVHVMCSHGKMHCLKILMVLWSLLNLNSHKTSWGLPWWRSGWESACQCRGHGFEPWSGRIPRAAEQLGPWATTAEPVRLEPVLRDKRGRDSERPAHRDEEWPPLAAARESPRTETKTQHSQINK